MYLSSPSGIISVTELNRQARQLLEGAFPVLWVAGEISGFKRYDSGHCYFTLKDAGAQVRCVMFRNRAALLDFAPREGTRVEARAVVSLYEARGDFQLTIEALRPAGLGALFEAFERLKRKLETEGLFSPARKRPLPTFPRAIGIVTSPAAAALRDVLTTLRRRMPGQPVILYPTAVQGADAAQQIAQAIRTAGERGEVDTLIVCRGGGSIEDLWSFNEEIVARAIAASPIPVVSGIGHETDFTIADFVADLRAPTPTAAAELATPDRNALLARLEHLRHRLDNTMTRQLQRHMQRLDLAARRLQHPGERLARQRERLVLLTQRLHAAPRRQLETRRLKLDQVALRLTQRRPDTTPLFARQDAWRIRLAGALPRQLENQRHRLTTLAARLHAHDPQSPLQRGYALVTHADGTLLHSASDAHCGEEITVHFAGDSLKARVLAPR
ncbi:Exodeoxyribonuclease VII large subunit [Formivibrio citricus]|uniref:Exodeoxyribonuclease 7 large subunit n=1 Tax=Formivibrio citricus TaxID=83765 RepID=A0A1I4ZQT7_9NEIS|nr:exodeoxyribonuclease VII large subunit [Formivibrio citricus]SFN52508.1 Exodeoxyribonuclease VII large subunit [Formivibrio citricus]